MSKEICRGKGNFAHQQKLQSIKNHERIKAYKLVNRGQVSEHTAQENVSL